MPLQILLWKASKKWREAKPTLPPKKGGKGGVNPKRQSKKLHTPDLLRKSSPLSRGEKRTLPPKKGGEGGVKTLPLNVDQAQCNYWLQRQEYTPQLQE